MIRSIRSRWLLIVFSAVVVCADLAPTFAQDDPSRTSATKKEQKPLLEFRRVFVPADSPDQWPHRKTSYLPMRSEEFEQLVRRISGANPDGDPMAQPRITSATYYARLEDNQLVGSAKLNVSRSPEGSEFMRIGQLSVSITDVYWDGPKRRRAYLGTSGDDAMLLRVEEKGRLSFDWKKRPQSQRGEATRFRFAWPQSPSTTFVVDLPLKYDMNCPQGIVTSKASTARAKPGGILPKISTGYRRWTVALGSRSSGELLVTELAAKSDQVRAGIVQENQYQISPQGLLLVTTLRLDTQSPVDRLRVKVDRGLQPIYARHGGRDVRWSLPDERKPKEAMEIELSKAISGRGQEVTIGAIGQIQTDDSWQLPSMHVENVQWRAGQTSINLTPPLTVRKVTPQKCSLSAPIVDGTLELRQHSADASIILDIGKQSRELQARTGTTIDVGPREIVGQCVALLTLDQESNFEVALKVRPGWNIASVTSPDVSVSAPNVPTRENETIRVLLDEPLAKGEELRLVLSGQRNWPGARRQLVADDLVMVEPVAHASVSELLLVRAKPPYQLKTRGSDRLTPIARNTLDVKNASLFNEGDSGLLVVRDENASFLQVELGSTGAKFAAEIAQNATIEDQWLTETYQIKVKPGAEGSSPIQRLRVLLIPGRDDPLHWSLNGRSEEEVEAKRVRSSRRDMGEKNGSAEMWEITLPQPQSQPFELKAVRATEFESSVPICLASVVDATSEAGAVRVASNDRMIGVRNNGLTPASASAEDSEGVALAYTYDPKTAVLERKSASLTLSLPEESGSPPLAWAANLSLEARFFPPDRVLYCGTYAIRNRSPRVASIVCPLGCVVRAVRIDGRDVAKTGVYESAGSDAERTLLIPLQGSDKSTLVSVDYSVRLPPRDAWDHWTPAVAPLFPEIDMPVVARSWVLWLPPEYSVVSAASVGPRSAWAPLSISRRLFGPLARADHETTFDPFDEESWRAPFRTASSEDMRNAELLLDKLGHGTEGEDSPAALGDVLQGFVQQENALSDDASTRNQEAELLIDASALRILSISPSTNIARSSIREGSGHWLEEHDLCLLAHAEAIVLTTRRRVSLYRDQVEWCAPLPVYTVSTSPLDEAIAESVANGEQATWLTPAAEWLFDTERTDSQVADKESQVALGWRMVVPVSRPGEAAASVRIVRTADIAMWAWLLLTATAALAWWRALAFPRTAVLLAAGFAISALLLPMGLAPIATAGFAGVCLGTLFRATPRLARSAAATWQPTTDAPRSESKLGTLAQTTIWILVASLVALALSSGVFAQDKSGSDKLRPSAPVDRVLIPIDKDGKPTGDHYFVPESMYERLRHLGGKSSFDKVRSLVESAEYRVELQRRPGTEGLTAGAFHGHFTIEALESGARVWLPFDRSEVEFVAGKSFVNDRPVAIEWSSEGSAIRLDLEEAGRYRVHLQWKLKSTEGGKASRVDVKIPRTPNAQFEITRPVRATRIAVRTSAGDREFASEDTTVEGNLGPVGRLKFRWEGATKAGEPQTIFDVDQLSWMKVQPATVTLATKFRIAVTEGQIRTLQIECDPRLSLYPFEDGSPIAKVTSDMQPDRSIYRLTLKRPPKEQLSFTARFLLKDTSAVGSHDIPEVNLEGARRSRRWFAASVDPVHHAKEQPKAGLDSDLTEYVRLWSPSDADRSTDEILSAYRLTNDRPQWSLEVRPKTAPAEVGSQVDFVVDQRWVSAELQAVIQNRAAYRMRYVLRVPRDMEVERVEKVTKDGATKIRWRRSGGWVTCFFSEPQKDRVRLRLVGRMPVRPGEELTITDLGLEGEDTKSVAVRVFRHESVDVSVLKVDGLDLVKKKEPGRSLVDENRRLVASYRGNGRPFRISVRTVANEVKFEAATVISLRRYKGSWQWELACQVDVTSGILDRVALELPTSCDGPLELVSSMVDGPAVSAALSTNTRDDRLRLVLRPERPVTRQWRFRLKGTLATQGQMVRAPRVSAFAVGRHREYLRLPDGGAGWETAGLPRAGDAPPWMTPLDADPVLFDMTARNSTAIRKAGSGQSVRPTVILADILLALRTDAKCHGVARFDLYPAGRTSCQLRAPENIELVYATIDGRVAAVRPKDSDTWEVALASDQLPQSMEVVFRGKLASQPVAGARLVVDSPWLFSDDLPLEANQTLWTIGPLPELEILSEMPSAKENVAASALDAVRAEAMVIAMRGAMGKEVPNGWASPWVARHTHYVKSIDSLEVVEDTLIDTQLAAWLLSVGVATPAELPHNSKQLSAALRDGILLDADDVYASRAKSWVFDQQQREMTISLEARHVVETPERTGWAIAIALLATAACVGISRTGRTRLERRVRTVWMRGRYAIVAAVGIVWWLWLWPSFLGLVVVLLASILALRPVREAAAHMPGGSTVMRRSNLDR